MAEPAADTLPPYGEQVVSWVTVLEDLAPADEWIELWHDDASATELHRLRGLASSQASETEAALAQVLGQLDPGAILQGTAGQLLRLVEAKLPEELQPDVAEHIRLIDDAIKRRNRLVHDTIQIGSSRMYGEYVPVIALLGGDETDEVQLRKELALQQRGTRAAVKLFLAIHAWQAAADGN